MTSLPTLCVAYGDGIGPEIMSATLKILEAAGAHFPIKTIEIGEQVYLNGFSSGIRPEDWETLKTHKLLLKAPITTPQGGGYKSLNVSLRKTLGLFANVRPCKAYAPYIKTFYPQQDLVIIRENEEDLYAGIEHQQTLQVIQCLKLVSVPGCERIIRYAFEYARNNQRRKITCMTKDNIMKLTDGLFHRMFRQIAAEYPEIEIEHLIVDIGAALLATAPEKFDVIVSLNLYGDILSDIAAQVAGSVGLAGSANIGADFAMFEAIHGSAPAIAGKDLANPSGLIQAAIQMLNYLNAHELAANIETAWLKTIADGIHTADIANDTYTQKVVGTQEFAAAVIERLELKHQDKKSETLISLPHNKFPTPLANNLTSSKELVGVDIFLAAQSPDIDNLAALLQQAAASNFSLSLITNRGTKVWPDGSKETLCTDHWRCRFKFNTTTPQTNTEIVTLLNRIDTLGLQWIKLENLYNIDGQAAYSLGQGE
jgi:isocitrate dehydrogenase